MKIKMDLLKKELKTLVIFNNIYKDKLIKNLIKLLNKKDIKYYVKIVNCLYCKNANISDYILELILQDYNLYVDKYIHKQKIDAYVENTLNNELFIISKLMNIKSDDILDIVDENNNQINLPKWKNAEIDIVDVYKENLKNIEKIGFGVFSKYNFFSFENKKIKPVIVPDIIDIESFTGYNLERKKLINNIEALINTKNARNVLLYGDAGTGKSSSIKALANVYKEQGIRLVEVKKNNLHNLPILIKKLANNPLKFIIFIDDLSFSTNDDNFTALKAVLEGSAYAINENVIICATSNRRHLVKETFSARQGDEIHLNDTREEMNSLSARFGLTITFSKPDKELYLEIVKDLAQKNNINVNLEDLYIKAEAFALRKSTRSPRVAIQFIKEYLCDNVNG